ncbi:MAG: BamA/TamA family outer membrane protein [Novosphingobium sp.]|nr:BamA/TamA family outer membrane protein [Novosphingobium sp.]
MIRREKPNREIPRSAAVSLAVLAALIAVPVLAQESDEPLSVPAPPQDASLPQVPAIIEDEEFEQAVPALSPEDDVELDRELESIEDFERRLATEEAKSADDVPLGDPALADGDKSEEISDAPVRDAELAQPLPPIESFEVTPVEFAEAAPDEESTSIAYRVQVNGLEKADDETKVGLRSLFNGLSALRENGRKAANVAMVQARLEQDSELMQTILASEGWYSPVVKTRIDLPTGEGENAVPMTAVIDVVPGTRYVLGTIEVVADPMEPPGLIVDSLALQPDEPIIAERVQGAEANVSLALPQQGYPFAEVGQRSILLDRDTGKGDYKLPVTVGPRSRFGGFETEGDLAFNADHIEVLARFDRGELYDSRKEDDLRKALVATGLFSSISVEPKRTGESAGDGTEYVTMYVKQDAGPPRTIAGTVGYGSGEGLRAEATWTHRNLFPPEGALIAHAVAGTKEQGAGLTFRRSNAGKRDRTFEVVAEALHSQYDAYSAYTGRLAAQMRRTSTPLWQEKFTYAFGVELLATAERAWDYDLGRNDRKTYYIGALNGQVGIDFSDDLLDPTKGFRVTALVQPEGSLQGGFNPYVRARVDASGYFPVSDSLVLAGRVRFGTIQGVSRDAIPPSRRFYAGGGGSVRGYAYQKLGPLDPDGDPIGGRSLFETSAEVRYRFGDFGVVGFVDAGQSYAATTPQFSDIRYGAGIGARYYTNFGPMRIDLATPVNRKPGEGRFNLYVSIGQAF